MNIFVLDRDPAIAASMHCDQHLHKMILESAQMLSTAARSYMPYLQSWNGYYKPTHANHPCTEWIRSSKTNAAWLVALCYALESERQAACNCNEHASMHVVKLFEQDVLYGSCDGFSEPLRFVFAGPADIAADCGKDIVAAYRAYYRRKNREWNITTTGAMTWKNRSVPSFMIGEL